MDVYAAGMQWGEASAASLIAAAWDVRTQRIPNILTIPLLVGGLAAAGCTGGIVGFLDASAACIVLALPYMILFVLVGGGAGDAKLMGAIGTWVGLANGLIVLLSVLLAGAIWAVGAAVLRGRLRSLLADVVRIVVRIVAFGPASQGPIQQQGGQEMPYGVAIAAGVCMAATVVFACRAL